ncbi:Pollen Ole e 1 allergen and extensin family protein [Rhynchospora pubera]|uniref:Pollen Ole e 1 allergen and extensin family protein n=1 Tax=Rhynchospora pubera TaxID=906938 RepID=A0AAV8CUY3_9POAL|nr:Pollen Ole e 1 allergen and extensin family protein [Rhynchospora pubera]
MARPIVMFVLLPVSIILFLMGEVLRVNADTMVTGMVFCDQCKDGQRSFFDYPLYGAKVVIECGGGNGPEEDTTNWFGNYAVRFDGSVDLTGCTARVVEAPGQCGSGFGPAQELTLIFRFFGSAMYTAAPLLAQPGVPMSYCPKDENPSPPQPVLSPPSPPRLLPPPLMSPPPQVLPAPVRLPPVLPPPYPPIARLPPLFPTMQAAACPHEKWLMPQFQCYWKVVTPNTSVALAFGPIAAARYGPDMTLWDGLQGRGDAYHTLLREATTSLLNSYNSLRFFYSSLRVIGDMNAALLGSTHQALRTALRFRRANSGVLGSDRLACNFSPCN